MAALRPTASDVATFHPCNTHADHNHFTYFVAAGHGITQKLAFKTQALAF